MAFCTELVLSAVLHVECGVDTPGQWQSAPALNSAVHYLQTIAASITLSIFSEKGAQHLIKARFHEMVGETVRFRQTSLTCTCLSVKHTCRFFVDPDGVRPSVV